MIHRDASMQAPDATAQFSNGSSGIFATPTSRTHEDRQVWSQSLERIGRMVGRSTWHHPTYVANFAWFSSLQASIPNLDAINAWLGAIGWRAVYVAGYVPAAIYREMNASRVFPLTWSIRQLRDIDHSAAPDFVHDVLGHMPMLFDERYRNLVERWAQKCQYVPPSPEDSAVADCLAALIAARERPEIDQAEISRLSERLAVLHAEAIRRCSRFFQFETFYTWAIEFGVIDTGRGSPQLIGAAALSSLGEMERIFNGDTVIGSFCDDAVSTAVDYTRYQRRIFKVSDFDHYFAVLDSI